MACTTLVPAATLVTDKPDYPPGATVTITGTGFGDSDDVTVQVLHVDGGDDLTSPAHQPWHVTAGTNGFFQTTWTIPTGEDELGATLQVSAAGQPSGLTASATFSDSVNNDFKQVANNDGAPWGPGNVHWIGSTLQANNSKYFEGMSTPQRLILSGIPATVGNNHTLHINHQANKSTTTHSYDYLTSWNQAVAAANVIGGPLLLTNLAAHQCGDEIAASLAPVCSALHSTGFTISPSAPDNMGILLGDNI